jgi:ribosome biogenesis GTPase A
MSVAQFNHSHRLQDRDKFLLTPFERNIEVWRQLWRVLERSQLVVQIVDARNPLRFRCEDLESYVYDVEGIEGEQGTGRGVRRSLLLINKSDLLTSKQRSAYLLPLTRIWSECTQTTVGGLLRCSGYSIRVLLCVKRCFFARS